jgi:hypothetical protein
MLPYCDGCRTFIDEGAAFEAMIEEACFAKGQDRQHNRRTTREWRVRHKLTDEVRGERTIDLTEEP